MAKIDSVSSWRPDQKISRNLEEGKDRVGGGGLNPRTIGSGQQVRPETDLIMDICCHQRSLKDRPREQQAMQIKESLVLE